MNRFTDHVASGTGTSAPKQQATMRAWQVPRLGEPADVLTLAEVPVPAPGDGQIQVKVLSAALNFPDVLLVRGHYQMRPPLPFTPGVELCGQVTAVGPRVTRCSVGDRVIGTPLLPHGGLAPYALMSAHEAFRAPATLDDDAAASLHIAYQTGWFGLHRRAALQPGETLLVHAAAGGVGSAAVQLGKAAGARVIAVVGGAEKAEVARDLGADLVINRREQDFVAAVKDATGGKGADVIYDPVGGEAFAGSTKCVAFEGRILIVGFASGVIPAPQLAHALVKNYSLVGLHWGLYKQHDLPALDEAHERLTELAASGVVMPLIGGRLSLAEAAAGLTRLAAGDTVGRLVVRP